MQPEPRRREGRPAVDPEAAFAFYASLPAERRSYEAVAAEFGISARTVERYGRDGAWRQRVAAIEQQAQSELDEQLGQERARQLADVKKLIDASYVSYARQLAAGDVRFTPSGFVSVVKLALDQLTRSEQPSAAGPSQPAARSFEHKLEVLRGLREAGAFAAIEQALDASESRDDHQHADHDSREDERHGDERADHGNEQEEA